MDHDREGEADAAGVPEGDELRGKPLSVELFLMLCYLGVFGSLFGVVLGISLLAFKFSDHAGARTALLLCFASVATFLFCRTMVWVITRLERKG